jgi:hypothetical protein
VRDRLCRGLISGPVAALVYCQHYPEISAPFIGLWYLLGTLIPADIGAMICNAVQRW